MLGFIQTVTFIVAGLLFASPAANPKIPDTLGRWNNRPIWVASESAVDSSGRPNAALLGEHIAERASEIAKSNTREAARHRSSQQAANSSDECLTLVGFRVDHYKSNRTFEDLVAGAETIVAGTVLSQRQGILYDTPGTLLLLSADYLKGQKTPVTYLFYPYAAIKTADGMWCSRPMNLDELPPSVGDRFISFSMLRPIVDGEVTILLSDPNKELLRETATGRLTLPVALRSEAVSAGGFDAVRDRIRKAQQLVAK